MRCCSFMLEANRRRCSPGSRSSWKALASSTPQQYNSKRSAIRGSLGRDSGTSTGAQVGTGGHTGAGGQGGAAGTSGTGGSGAGGLRRRQRAGRVHVDGEGEQRHVREWGLPDHPRRGADLRRHGPRGVGDPRRGRARRDVASQRRRRRAHRLPRHGELPGVAGGRARVLRGADRLHGDLARRDAAPGRRDEHSQHHGLDGRPHVRGAIARGDVDVVADHRERHHVLAARRHRGRQRRHPADLVQRRRRDRDRALPGDAFRERLVDRRRPRPGRGRAVPLHAGDLILAVAQQCGSSHEDKDIEEPIAQMRSLVIGGVESHVAVLIDYTRLVIDAGIKFLLYSVEKGLYRAHYLAKKTA